MADRLRQIKKELNVKRAQYLEYDKNLTVLKNRIESLVDEITKVEKYCRPYRKGTKALHILPGETYTGTGYGARRGFCQCCCGQSTGRNTGKRQKSLWDGQTTALTNTFHVHVGTLSSYGISMEKCFKNDREDTSPLRWAANWATGSELWVFWWNRWILQWHWLFRWNRHPEQRKWKTSWIYGNWRQSWLEIGNFWP